MKHYCISALVAITAFIFFGLPSTATAELSKIWLQKMELPVSQQQFIKRRYNHANGCQVWLEERVEHKGITYGKRKVIYSYKCVRQYHRYKCGGPRVTAAAGAADYENKVVFRYRLAAGLPKFTQFVDAGNTNETECGRIIIDHLKSISIQ